MNWYRVYIVNERNSVAIPAVSEGQACERAVQLVWLATGRLVEVYDVEPMKESEL